MTLKEKYLEFCKLDECYRLLDGNILDNAENIQVTIDKLAQELKKENIEVTIEEYAKYNKEGEQLAKKIFTYLQQCFEEDSKLIQDYRKNS
jgi:hypothetical protein